MIVLLKIGITDLFATAIILSSKVKSDMIKKSLGTIGLSHHPSRQSL